MISNTLNNGLIIAVDGPSGAGKSTACRAVARQLDAKYLDTGAMYRVATLHVLRQGIDPTDEAAVVEVTAALPMQVNDDPASTEVLLSGEDVSREIRGPEVTKNVSQVSSYPQVRENLVALQRALATEAHRCIVDGRDIGTTVLVNAPAKIFLTASAEVRARRRYNQDIAAGREADYETVLADVQRRDELDSTRAVSPLRPAEDATIVDTSDMTFDQVVDSFIELARVSAHNDSNRG